MNLFCSVDCLAVLQSGFTTSGSYTICIGSNVTLQLMVYCDQTTDGGGWLVMYSLRTLHLILIIFVMV